MWITSFLSNRFQRVVVNIATLIGNLLPVAYLRGPSLELYCLPSMSMICPLLFPVSFLNLLMTQNSIIPSPARWTSRLYKMTWTYSTIGPLIGYLDSTYISKCKTMHIGRFTSDDYTYFINNQPLPTVELEKDLGVFVDNHLKFHDHTAAVVSKANRILAIINKSFTNLGLSMFPILYKVLVRPILEYGNAVWGPFFVTDQIAIEKVQRRTTKLVTSIMNLSYNERLSILKLPSLYYRRRRGDMILVYQTFHGLIDINPSIFFAPATISTTRGHNYKIFKPHSQDQTFLVTV